MNHDLPNSIEHSTESFRIIDKSTNTGSFGHNGFVMLAASGRGYHVQKIIGTKEDREKWQRGNDIEVPCVKATYKNGSSTVQHQWHLVGVEVPTEIATMSEAAASYTRLSALPSGRQEHGRQEHGRHTTPIEKG